MKLSIVIPTRNRVDVLSANLSHLLPQLSASDEVIIVDNGTDDTASMVNAREDSRIRYLYAQIPANASRARNEGFRSARNTIVCFLDDDSFVGPGWAAAVREISSDTSKKGIIFQGMVIQKYTTVGPIERQKYINFSRDTALLGMGLYTPRLTRVKMILAGNLFGSRSLFQKLNGPFDENGFPFIGEQADLTYRCFQHGIDIVYAPKAKVFHTKSRVLLTDEVRNAFGYGRAMKRLEELYLSDPRVLLAIGSVKPASKSIPIPAMMPETFADRIIRLWYRILINGSFRIGYISARV